MSYALCLGLTRAALSRGRSGDGWGRWMHMGPIVRVVASGMDADLTVFDPAKVIDKATFAEPAQKSVGISHVIVNGTFVVKQSSFLDGVRPGQPVRGDGGVASTVGNSASKRTKLD